VNGDVYGPKLREMVADAALPPGYGIWDCHAMFDRDVSGTITKKEFVQGMGRLIFSNDFQRSAMTQIAISDVLTELKAVETKVLAEIDNLRIGMGLAEPAKPAQPTEQPTETPNAAEDAVNNDTDERLAHVDELHVQPAYDNLPSCRALVERLQEPLAKLLSDALPADLSVPPPAPVHAASILAPEGDNTVTERCGQGCYPGMRALETRRGARGRKCADDRLPREEMGQLWAADDAVPAGGAENYLAPGLQPENMDSEVGTVSF